MKRKKVIIIVGCLVLLLVLTGAFVNFLIGAAIDQTYAPFQTAYSIEDAKQSQIFVSQPQLEQQTINLRGFKYSIQEVWIEEATSVKYEWIFFRKRIHTGYRLMATLTVPYDSPENKNLIGQSGWEPLVANEQIELSANVPAARKDTWLFYGHLNEPFPKQVTLAFKKMK